MSDHYDGYIKIGGPITYKEVYEITILAKNEGLYPVADTDYPLARYMHECISNKHIIELMGDALSYGQAERLETYLSKQGVSFTAERAPYIDLEGERVEFRTGMESSESFQIDRDFQSIFSTDPDALLKVEPYQFLKDLAVKCGAGIPELQPASVLPEGDSRPVVECNLLDTLWEQEPVQGCWKLTDIKTIIADFDDGDGIQYEASEENVRIIDEHIGEIFDANYGLTWDAINDAVRACKDKLKRVEETYLLQKINGDTWRPGFPEEGYLVRYGKHPDFGWMSCATFKTLEEAESFIKELGNQEQTSN
jgi:hypothetical protein